MAKIGRNQPCRCGSGKKYKQCCLAKDEEAAAIATQAAKAALRRRRALSHPCEHELDFAARRVIVLIEDGKLEEAHQAAVELRDAHPAMYDGYDCLAMVHQAKGEITQAITYYRKVIALALESPALYDPGFADYFRDIVDGLEQLPTGG